MADTKTRAPKTHCKRNHEYTPENTKMKNKGNGKYARECRTCHNMRSNEGKRRMNSASTVGPNGERLPRKKTTNSILGSTAFGKDCLTRAQIMALRDLK